MKKIPKLLQIEGVYIFMFIVGVFMAAPLIAIFLAMILSAIFFVILPVLSFVIPALSGIQPNEVKSVAFIFAIILCIASTLIVYWLWFYNVGCALHAKLKDKKLYSIKLFKIHFIIMIINYFAPIILYAIYVISSGGDYIGMAMYILYGIIFMVSFFSTIYILWFVASLTTFHNKKKKSFLHTIQAFLLCMLFIPIGIWPLHQQVQRQLGVIK